MTHTHTHTRTHTHTQIKLTHGPLARTRGAAGAQTLNKSHQNCTPVRRASASRSSVVIWCERAAESSGVRAARTF